MTLGRSVLESFRERAQVDREYREGCLEDTLDVLLSGETDDGLLSLHDHIYATIGFEELGALMGKCPDSLMEALIENLDEPGSAMSASALLEIIGHLREREGVDFKVSVVRRDASETRNGASRSGAHSPEMSGGSAREAGSGVVSDAR